MDFIKRCFRTKNLCSLLQDLEQNLGISSKLKGTMSLFQLIALGMGAVIGSAIFVIIGTIVNMHTGPAVVLSLVLAGVGCIGVGLCYAELASLIPASGGAYIYVYVAFGEIIALIAGILHICSYMCSLGIVGKGISAYFTSLLADFGVNLGAIYTHHTGAPINTSNGEIIRAIADIPALLVIIAVTFVLYRGAKFSTLVGILVLIKMGILWMFIASGITKINPENWLPFIPENTTGEFGKFGISGIVAGAASVFLAYIGFDVLSVAAQEAKKPQRNVPIGVISVILLSTLTYMLVALVLTGVVYYTDPMLNEGQPLAVAADKMSMPWFSLVIKIGAIVALSSVLLARGYGIIRMLLTIAYDGLLPRFFLAMHQTYCTPHVAAVVVGLITTLMAAVVPLYPLMQFTNLCLLLTYIIVCLSCIYLRYSQPKLKRGFLCPVMPVLPIFTILLFLQMLYGLPYKTYIHGLILLVVVLIFYFVYGQRNSTLQQQSSKLSADVPPDRIQ